MGDSETAVETNRATADPGTATVLIGIATPTDGVLLRQRAQAVVDELRTRGPGLSLVVAYPGTEGASDSVELKERSDRAGLPAPPLSFIEYPLPQAIGSTVPWLGLAPAYRRLSVLAANAGAGACVILAPDLAAFDARSINALVEPVLDGRAELVMPQYAPSKFEGLLNSSILYPFTRALYGRRVRYPLGPDFGLSVKLLTRLSKPGTRVSQADQEQSAVWPATEAVASDGVVAQVHLDGRHGVQNDGLDLTTVLGHLSGSLFSDAEKYAVVWQRVRGSQPGLTLGGSGVPVDESDVADTRPMLEAFYLASRNLQEVWSLVLPPVTLLEIKRLVRLPPEDFRISDPLWARIIYDFALAYRLRTLSRTHLLGALTPLYLGWVASYVQGIAGADAAAAEQRIERLAKAYEDEKGYMVSRWRWPDRFNP